MRQAPTDGQLSSDGLEQPQREERALRIARIKYRVKTHCHWSEDQFIEWWHKPSLLLDYRTPCQLAYHDLDKLERFVDYALS